MQLSAATRILPTVERFDPVTFIGEDWRVVESDLRATAFKAIDFTEVILESCREQFLITGEEKLKRLKKNGEEIRLGAEAFQALWDEKDHKTLEWFYEEKKVICLDFFGTILDESPTGAPGVRCVLYLYRGYDGWRWSCCSLDNVWHGDGRFFASLACKRPRTFLDLFCS